MKMLHGGGRSGLHGGHAWQLAVAGERGRSVILVLALHAILLQSSVDASSTSTAAAAGPAFVGNGALVPAGGMSAKRSSAERLACRVPKILSAAKTSLRGRDLGTLRLRGGSLLDRCLPVSLKRQPPTRTCFTSVNMVEALAESGEPPRTASPATLVPRVVFILGGPGAGKVNPSQS